MTLITRTTFVVLAVVQIGTAADTAVAILQKNCASCHGAAQMSGFDVRDRSAVLKVANGAQRLYPDNRKTVFCITPSRVTVT